MGAVPSFPPRLTPRLVLCAHEAGHAVAAACRGLTVGEVVLDPPGWGRADILITRGDLARYLFVLAAGPAAAAEG